LSCWFDSGALDDSGFSSIRRPLQYFTSGVDVCDFLGERLRPKKPVGPVLDVPPPSRTALDRNHNKYPIANNPTPTNAMGICADGVNAATARITTPAIVRLLGLRLILDERFLPRLRFGAVPVHGSNAFGLLTGCRGLPASPVVLAPMESSALVFSSISSISRSNFDLSGISEYYPLEGCRVAILEL
jgi:hypothetical protein